MTLKYDTNSDRDDFDDSQSYELVQIFVVQKAKYNGPDDASDNKIESLVVETRMFSIDELNEIQSFFLKIFLDHKVERKRVANHRKQKEYSHNKRDFVNKFETKAKSQMPETHKHKVIEIALQKCYRKCSLDKVKSPKIFTNAVFFQ